MCLLCILNRYSASLYIKNERNVWDVRVMRCCVLSNFVRLSLASFVYTCVVYYLQPATAMLRAHMVADAAITNNCTPDSTQVCYIDVRIYI